MNTRTHTHLSALATLLCVLCTPRFAWARQSATVLYNTDTHSSLTEVALTNDKCNLDEFLRDELLIPSGILASEGYSAPLFQFACLGSKAEDEDEQSSQVQCDTCPIPRTYGRIVGADLSCVPGPPASIIVH